MEQSLKKPDSLDRIFRILVIVVLSGVILKVGSPLFIPVSFALFVSFILQPFCRYLESKGWGRVLSIVTGLLLISVLIGALLFVLYLQFRNFAADWDEINVRFSEMMASLKEFLVTSVGLPREQVEQWISGMISSTAGNTLGMIETTVISIFVNVVMVVLIPIYAFLILYYRAMLAEVLYSLFPESQRKKVADVLSLSINTYYNFIKGMAVVYLMVGVLNSLGLWILGIPHPFLFGFLTAIMTFIPYIGIIIASILPITYGWITYGSILYPMGVIAIFTFVQYLEANVIFPWAVSQRLQLNTLITLMVIVIGGILWGASGMILFVPFAAILKLIADRMEGWESLSRFLGK